MADKVKKTDEKVKVPRFRMFNCLQYEFNPKTGEDLHFNEQNIIKCVAHKSIDRYAYIRHDKDTITEVDIETGRGQYDESDLGKKKGAHWHIVIETSTALPIATIAKWLGVPENMIDIPVGRGAFIDCVEYLRHSDIKQRLNGKYEYEIDEVKANFDWMPEVENLILRKTKYEKPLSQSQFIKNEILYNGLTLREVAKKYPTFYQEELAILHKLRAEYLLKFAETPNHRVNYYIEGKSGYGKDTLAYSFARSLYPELGDEAYFEIGSEKVTFDGYDGEPVIVWSEFRADTFVRALGGYENVLPAIDIIPKKKRNEHKKFGHIKLVNSVNIITATQPYEEFLRGLIPVDDPDPTQAHRRLPVIIKLHPEDFDILINAGYLGEDTYKDYAEWKNIVGSFSKVASRLNAHTETQKVIEAKLNTPLLEAHSVVEKGIVPDPYADMSEEDILKEYEHYGEQADLQKQYLEWLEEWYKEHPNCKASNNHPSFEYWKERRRGTDIV